MATPERLRELSIGYDLDTGGYEFENAPEALGGAVVVLDDPDLDYMGLHDAVHDYYSHSCPVLAFAPNTGHFPRHEFPESYEVEDHGTMVKVFEGDLRETDHECHCHGKLVEWFGAAGEPTEPLDPRKVVKWVANGTLSVDTDGRDVENFMFQHTGNTSDKPYPDCDRCGGDGHLTSHGGEWAIYALKDEDDE